MAFKNPGKPITPPINSRLDGVSMKSTLGGSYIRPGGRKIAPRGKRSSR